MLLLSLIAIANLALALAGNVQDTRVYYQDPSSTFGLVGVSSSYGDIYRYPGGGLVDQIIHVIDGSSGHGGGHGGGHHGQGGGHHGHGGGYPGQGGGYPGQGGGYPGQGGGYPGQGGGYPGQGGGYPGQGGGYPGQGGGYPGQGGGYPGQGGGYPGQGGGHPGHGGHGGHGGHYPNVRPGSCPPVRSYCPSYVLGEPHLTCSRDSSCTNNYRDKCCYDRCLNEHVCKSPQHFGR